MKTLLLFFVSLALISFKPDNSKWLLVIHARSGSISNGVLKLNDPDKLVATFKADGEREAKALDLNQMILNWGAMFQSSPPNAAIAFKGSAGKSQEHIVILQPPKIVSGILTFQIIELGPALNGDLGETIVYVDSATSATHVSALGNKPATALDNNQGES